MMKVKEQCILGIEGSGFSNSVAVWKDNAIRGMNYLNDGSPGSESLLATVDQLLNTLKLDKTELNGVCVSLGPGSFTSLRISLALAESLGLGLNIPVYGVDTLQLMAATVPYYSGQIKVIQNAYKGEFYTATYSTKLGRPELLDSLRLIEPQTFYELLDKDDLLLGTGVTQLIKKGFDLSLCKVKWNQDFIRYASAALVIEHFLEEEVREPSVKPLEPIYIRLSEAEINYKKQFGVRE